MRYLLRVFFFNVFALWFTSQILPTLTVAGDWQVLLTAGLILSLLMLIVAPILKILFIPINLLTFGLLSWLINVAVIYLLTFFVTSVEIQSFQFTGASFGGVVIPQAFIGYPVALIITSLTITCISNILHWASES